MADDTCAIVIDIASVPCLTGKGPQPSTSGHPSKSHHSANFRSAVLEASELADCLRLVAISRDIAAFAVLFEFYAPRLRAFFKQAKALRNSADDLVQETMLRVWIKAELFDKTKGSPSSWIYTIARNLRSDRLRAQTFEPLRHQLSTMSDSEPTADLAIEIAQTRSILHQALLTLSDEQASLMQSWLFDDRSHSEMASQRQLPLGTVKSLLRRGMMQLRLALAGKL